MEREARNVARIALDVDTEFRVSVRLLGLKKALANAFRELLVAHAEAGEEFEALQLWARINGNEVVGLDCSEANPAQQLLESCAPGKMTAIWTMKFVHYRWGPLTITLRTVEWGLKMCRRCSHCDVLDVESGLAPVTTRFEGDLDEW